jgi:hypothetical protein
VAASLAVFRKQLAAGELRPVYLIAGAEHLLVMEAADALRARAKELGYLERDVLDVEANFDWNQLGDASRTMSLFASRKLIDLRLPTGRPGKDGGAAISEYCASPPPDTVLLVTANDWSSKHAGAWSTAIERCFELGSPVEGTKFLPRNRPQCARRFRATIVSREMRRDNGVTRRNTRSPWTSWPAPARDRCHPACSRNRIRRP